jgi:hypothetical protein
MRGTKAWGSVVAALWALGVGGCASTPLSGAFGPPSFEALQRVCGAPLDYGDETPAVYSAFDDAYVAYRREGLAKNDYCGFQASVAEHHRALVEGGAGARADWAAFFNAARVKAIDWRAAVDPSLRGG